jgi:branched-chain amino acid transport system permease protein
MPTKPLSVRYEDDLRLLSSRWRQAGVVLLVGFALLVFPLRASALWLTLGGEILVFVVGAVGLMILTGFTGQISLGHSAFIGIGGYTAAILGGTYGRALLGDRARRRGAGCGGRARRRALRAAPQGALPRHRDARAGVPGRARPAVVPGGDRRLSGLSVPMLWWFDGPTA